MVFKACRVRDTPSCKTEDEWPAFYDGKQVMLLLNSQRLDNSVDEINSDAIVKESVLSWYSFQTSNPTTNRISMQRFAYGLQERNSVSV